MNLRSISFFLSLFCFPISLLSFINILYSSYFDYFLSIEAYFTTLILSLILGFSFYFFGKKATKNINFIEQLILIILVCMYISKRYLLNYYLQENTIIRKISFDFLIDRYISANWINLFDWRNCKSFYYFLVNSKCFCIFKSEF